MDLSLVARGGLEVPLLPEAAHRVLSAARAPEPDLPKLVALVGRDPALTGHVLRVANSAALARGTRLGSLPQAVNRLGTATIANMALLVSCRRTLFCAPGLERQVRALFRHSYATALFAQELARSRRLDVESAFVAGLMHDVGRPLLWGKASDAEIDAEHAVLSALIVERWQLGPRVAEAVRDHHGLPEAPATAVVQLADALCHELIDGEHDHDDGAAAPDSDSDSDSDDASNDESNDESDGAGETIAGHPARLALNLYDDELEAIVAHRDAVLAELDAVEALG